MANAFKVTENSMKSKTASDIKDKSKAAIELVNDLIKSLESVVDSKRERFIRLAVDFWRFLLSFWYH